MAMAIAMAMALAMVMAMAMTMAMAVVESLWKERYYDKNYCCSARLGSCRAL